MVACYYNPEYRAVRSSLLYEGGTVDLCARERVKTFPVEGESGVRVSAGLPRMFSRGKIRAYFPGSCPDRSE
jgi:hypothetical protein